MVSARFAERMDDKRVRHDVATIGDFVQIWCDGHHAAQDRGEAGTDAAVLGIYGPESLVLCPECETHLAYAEARRVYCPKEPKPFCAYCDTHCYREEEREWQRVMMRYSGPKSWRKGHAIDGIKHAIEGRKYKHSAQGSLREQD